MNIVGPIPAAVAGGSDREDENWKDITGYPRISVDIIGYLWIPYLDIRLDIIWIHLGYLGIFFGYPRISLDIILGYSIGYHLDTSRTS